MDVYVSSTANMKWIFLCVAMAEGDRDDHGIFLCVAMAEGDRDDHALSNFHCGEFRGGETMNE